MHLDRRTVRGLAALVTGGAVNGERIRVHPRDYVAEYEPDAWSAVMSEVRPNTLFVDVGGHVGMYALGAARRGARVVSFEPDPSNAKRIRLHARLNRVPVHVVEAAVGDVDAPIVYAARASAVSGAADLYLSEMDVRVVPCLRLDSTLAGERVDMMKIDVEGYEGHVLRGARELLTDAERAPRVLMVEVHAGREEEVPAALGEYGYVAERLSSPEASGPSRWLFRRTT